jgi:glutamine---fructose-6-phosphate transaminase (isomerizing)
VTPKLLATVAPSAYAVPAQLMAIMGTDVDQPRNLAKSMTVE